MTNWTDDRIERLLTEWLRERTPEPMPERAYEHARRVVSRRSRSGVLRSWLALAAVVAVVGGGGLLAAAGFGQRPAQVTEPPRPTKQAVAPSAAANDALENVDDAGIFGATGLWARVGGQLYLSSDRAASWRSIGGLPTAPEPGLTALSTLDGNRAAFVLDESHAWIAGRTRDSVDGGGGAEEHVTLMLYRTDDGGATWSGTSLDGNFANMTVALSFVDANTGYLLATSTRMGTGGSRVLMTNNGGRGWKEISQPAGLDTVLNPTSLDTVWIGADPEAGPIAHTLLAVSRDSGQSWSDVELPGFGGLVGGTQAAVLAGPRFFGATDGVVIVNRLDAQSGTVVERTSDGGRTWQIAVRRPEADTADIVDAETWLVGLHRTTDGGRTWTDLPLSGRLADRPVTRVMFWTADSGALLAPLVDGPVLPAALFVTHDGGTSWAAVSPQTSAGIAISPSPSASVAESAEPSASASESNAEPTLSAEPNLVAVAFFDRAHGLIGGGLPNAADSGSSPTEGAIWRTVDGGRTWGQVGPKAPPITGLATVGTSLAWASASCEDGTCGSAILSSTDGGATWQKISDVSASPMTFVDGDHGWAVVPGRLPSPGGLLLTTTGGRTWQTRPSPCPFGWPSAVSFVSLDHGWVGCTGGGASTNPKAVLETTDGGRTWLKRAVVDLPGGLPSHGSIDFFDELEGLFMRENGTGMWWGGRGTTQRTTDGGLTWRSSPPGSADVVIEAAGQAIDDRQWLMLGWNGDAGETSLVLSRDAGTRWKSVATLP
jgi:photosystem II stability/assembly factor-like uncharacterized protein